MKLDSLDSLSLLNLLNEKLDITITLTGDSMFPLWRHKSNWVVLTKCDSTILKIGDIPLYRRNSGQYVLHRIIRVNNGCYDLCGDAQTLIEHNVRAENIIGVVKSFSRKGKNYSCSDFWIRVYAFVWMAAIPFRKVLLKVIRVRTNPK